MTTRARPRLWPFALGLTALLPLWVLILETYVKPDLLSPLAATPQRRLLAWLLPPVVVVLGLFAGRWGWKAYRLCRERVAAHAEQRAREARDRAEAAAAQARRDHDHYSLEVYGVGLELDKYTERTIWKALKAGDPWTTILPTDPKEYPWSWQEKGPPGASVYEAAIKEFPEKWELPFLLGGPAMHNADYPDDLKSGLAGARSGGGMHYHRFRTVSQIHDDNPDRLPAELFALFDQHPELPVASIAVEDSMYMRDMYRPPHTPTLIKDGHELPAVTTSCAVVLVGRRDRVDLLRPTATDIPIPKIQIPFEYTLIDAEDIVPEGYVLSYDDAPPETQVPDRQHHLRPFWEAEGGAPAAFKPSRFVKRPWCQEQLVVFDLLPIRARIHRPQTAQYVVDGKALGPRGRQEAFLEAWKQALATLPPGAQPVRVIYDFGPGGAARMVPLSLALQAAGPDLDAPGRDGLDLTVRLRDTGADSFYVGIVLGILGTEQEGGVSAVVDLRRDDRATILMVSPPTAQDRVKRRLRFYSDYLGRVEQD